jgi:6,7-dimethyl-8-ribityllumazine synthase
MPIIPSSTDSKSQARLAIVTSLFNEKWTKKLEAGALQTLAEHDLTPLAQVYVPGAVEIPLAVKALLQNPSCDGVIALGLVIRGETSHYDYVCNAVERGCSQLQLEFGKPVAFGVLTTENKDQAKARCGGRKGNKGAEAAQVALDMLQVLGEISNLKG